MFPKPSTLNPKLDMMFPLPLLPSLWIAFHFCKEPLHVSTDEVIFKETLHPKPQTLHTAVL
jgi:hypothetical protein